MSKIKLDTILWCQPIVGPHLSALPIATDPTPDKVSLIGVTVDVTIIPVKKTMSDRTARGNVREDPFNAQIEFRSLGKVRKVQPSGPRRSVPIRDGGQLIVCKSIGVKCRPIAKERQTIAEIETRASVSR